MDMQEKITVLGLMLEDGGMVNESGELLEAYLNIAGRKILNLVYPFDDTKTEVPERYINLQIEIAAYLINKRGAEGQVSHSENGISRGYEDADIPLSMLRGIVPFVGGL